MKVMKKAKNPLFRGFCLCYKLRSKCPKVTLISADHVDLQYDTVHSHKAFDLDRM